jgi:hypothetical protein
LFLRFKVAPTITAPEGSEMVPLIAPVTMLCAEIKVGSKSNKAKNETGRRKYL